MKDDTDDDGNDDDDDYKRGNVRKADVFCQIIITIFR